MKKNLIKSISLGLVTVLGVAFLSGCGAAKNDEKVIKVGATPSPHAEILEQIESVIEEKGYTLEIVEYNDYVLPNTATFEGELDANFFQHGPYLENFNTENKTDLVSVAAVHFEPLGLYSTTVTKVEDIEAGAIIAVPNDATNEARALLLLEANGLITLKEGAGINATINDIETNPLGIEIKEIEAAQLARSLQDVDAAVINGNYALEGGLKVTDAICLEESTSVSAETYANILVVKEGHQEDEKIKVLVDALLSEAVKKYIEENYGGAVVPVF